MEYNTCIICGAKDGRAGLLFSNDKLGLVPACENCHKTRTTGIYTIYGNLTRTDEELLKILDILDNTPEDDWITFLQELEKKT